jgi:hypothetical protein
MSALIFLYIAKEKQLTTLFILEINYREILKVLAYFFSLKKKKDFGADLNNGLCSQELCALVSNVG